MPSVIEAAINNAEARISCSPGMLWKRLLERIQISSGILKMRVSVMELGRFTGRRPSARRHYCRDKAVAQIMRHVVVESNDRRDGSMVDTQCYNHNGGEIHQALSFRAVS